MSKRFFVVLLLLVLLQPQNPAVISANTSEATEQPTKIIESSTFDNGVVNVKRVLFPNGDIYWIKQFIFAADKKEPFTVSVPLSGTYGTFRYVEGIPDKKYW